MRSGIAGVDAVVLINAQDERLVAVFLGPECSRHILRVFHDAAALVIEAEDGGHHISAGTAFQGGSNLRLVANGPGGARSSTKPGGKEESRWIPAPASVGPC